MGLLTKSAFFAKLLLIFNAIYIPALGETGCPPAEDITPCVCTDSPTTILKCSNIDDLEDVQTSIRGSKRYTFQEVHVINCVIPYIPSQGFENSTVKELYVVNSSMVTLFDKPPKSSDLLKLHVENSRFTRNTPTNLTNLSNLEILYVDTFIIRSLDRLVTSNLPRSVKQLTFRGTKTKSIKAGAFANFPKLDKLVVKSNQLINVTRDALPRPSYIRFLYFDNNQMTSIPEDSFVDMPNLQFISLANNNLTEFPKTTFGSRERTAPYIDLAGNPLSCDCLLVWLVQDKPEILRGTCKTPKRLEGKSLRSLRPSDFNC